MGVLVPERRRCGRVASRRSKCVVPCALFFVFSMLMLWTATAIRFDDIQLANKKDSPEVWTKSVQAVVALEMAIEDATVREKVQQALKKTKKGFQYCSHNVYHCDDTGNAVDVIIDDLQDGRVNWDRFPATVKRIFVRNSVLRQTLILSELPRQLEVFSAVNTSWNSTSLLLHPGNVVGESSVALLTCGQDSGKKCVHHLQKLQCESCGLTEANLSKSDLLYPELTSINFNNNTLVGFDVHTVPATVTSLHISHVPLEGLSVLDVLSRLPKATTELNLSYTGVLFQWDTLKSITLPLTVLDLSGLTSTPSRKGQDNPDITATEPQPMSSFCDGALGKTLEAAYFVHSGLKGVLPGLAACTRLTVLDLSHNQLTRLPLDHLPPVLHVLRLSNNSFEEEMNVSSLPRGLLSLDVSSNRFSGPFKISDLPRSLAYFDISHNAFTGHVNLTELPETAKFVYLQYNNFTGEADLVDIPLGIRFIMVHHNNWDYRLPAP
ncbi:hypothetical protein ABB37_04804 [Leptomonas pyrrhocoris]|uniref:Leucine-rich repeat protein n=1 Tax=Leptomonas pyrrhocoris TaxID=157538 RepID=A0A0N0VFG5_LEPPY|nr:hypothetical protein ABB37_04804 [Leptomonas pyrrhocoris]KPA80608.1 hypothetical protein ABB37_04804 [Leptomonas pyrrhocoris]|eukprot:XP_015659047.1 hypothetical protein ABB37_04804 [Leptomonas pyrrhocoris]